MSYSDGFMKLSCWLQQQQQQTWNSTFQYNSWAHRISYIKTQLKIYVSHSLIKISVFCVFVFAFSDLINPEHSLGIKAKVILEFKCTQFSIKQSFLIENWLEIHNFAKISTIQFGFHSISMWIIRISPSKKLGSIHCVASQANRSKWFKLTGKRLKFT